MLGASDARPTRRVLTFHHDGNSHVVPFYADRVGVHVFGAHRGGPLEVDFSIALMVQHGIRARTGAERKAKRRSGRVARR